MVWSPEPPKIVEASGDVLPDSETASGVDEK